MSTPASHGGNAPPPPPEAETATETPAAATPPSEADTTAEVLPAPQAVAVRPPRALPGLPPTATSVRAEPSWRELGWWLSLAESGSDDARARGGAAALRLYYVQQLGLPLWAAGHLSVINKRLVVSSELLRAIALRAGYDVLPEDWSDETCTAAVVRRSDGEVIGRYTFTMDDARRADLVRPRSGWITHPRRMLWARAAGFALRDAIPDVVLGFQTREEADEIYAAGVEPIGVDAGYTHGTPDDLRERDEDIPFRALDPFDGVDGPIR